MMIKKTILACALVIGATNVTAQTYGNMNRLERVSLVNAAEELVEAVKRGQGAASEACQAATGLIATLELGALDGVPVDRKTLAAFSEHSDDSPISKFVYNRISNLNLNKFSGESKIVEQLGGGLNKDFIKCLTEVLPN